MKQSQAKQSQSVNQWRLSIAFLMVIGATSCLKHGRSELLVPQTVTKRERCPSAPPPEPSGVLLSLPWCEQGKPCAAPTSEQAAAMEAYLVKMEIWIAAWDRCPNEPMVDAAK